MAQLSLYMEEPMMDALRLDAEKMNLSISSYVRKVLEQRHSRDTSAWINGWPPGYFDLYGSIPDFPDVEECPIERSI